MKKTALALLALCLGLIGACTKTATTIPLPEHPRPDFERAEWLNLNGYWDFTFDEALAAAVINPASETAPTEAKKAKGVFDRRILVPFPWGSPLSEVPDSADVAWYSRSITIPAAWEGKRVFLVVGASDYETTLWFDGKELGSHQGGYTPFEFELTAGMKPGELQRIVLKADDTYNPSHLYGKQGYGNARGIWQTVYLEARGTNFIKGIHFSPDVDASSVRVGVTLDAPAAQGQTFCLNFKTGDQKAFSADISGLDKASFVVKLQDQHLWDIDDPFLYEVHASLESAEGPVDELDTYFGQRKISVVPFPGADFKYVALNDKPIYLQLCLDQSYHPEGFYTFPSDEFMKHEVEISKEVGLNGNRIHIKVEVPRKLYWADKLGLLIMADTPNFWGKPVPEAREDWEYCLRNQLERDYNHPSIFAWVNFNETWGLKDSSNVYNSETQEWVRSMYHLTKRLDPTRLVEDNSACNFDHVQTDINSWHAYKRGRMWDQTVADAVANTFPGSSWNFIGGNVQTGEPMMNSECGNVWGYDGSSGDCDYTWDYHIMINAFRRNPKCCGWLYTEHHDVINEWNGYVKYDRSPKVDGLGDLVPGMTIADFQSLYYIAPECYLYTEPRGGEHLDIPFYASFMTDKDPGALTLETELVGWDQLGRFSSFGGGSIPIAFEPFLSRTAGTLAVDIPEAKGVYLLRLVLKAGDKVLHRNFTTFRVKEGKDIEVEGARLVPFAPASFTAQEWSNKQTAVYGGLKENGFGHGYFEYSVNLPEDVDVTALESVELVFEASAKEWFGKDRDGNDIKGDFMLGKGTFDHCKSPNSYAMTDLILWPSKLVVSVNGKDLPVVDLPDDPADHRGILSWGSQPPVRKMSEGGSYGYLCTLSVPVSQLVKDGPQVIRFNVPENDLDGGLALYGKDFGRYPLDPTLVLKLK